MREPRLPGDWEICDERLSLYPDGGWRLVWSYRRAEPLSVGERFLDMRPVTIEASTKPLLRYDYRGEASDLGQGVTGLYIDGLGLCFTVDGLHYRVQVRAYTADARTGIRLPPPQTPLNMQHADLGRTMLQGSDGEASDRKGSD